MRVLANSVDMTIKISQQLKFDILTIFKSKDDFQFLTKLERDNLSKELEKTQLSDITRSYELIGYLRKWGKTADSEGFISENATNMLILNSPDKSVNSSYLDSLERSFSDSKESNVLISLRRKEGQHINYDTFMNRLINCFKESLINFYNDRNNRDFDLFQIFQGSFNDKYSSEFQSLIFKEFTKEIIGNPTLIDVGLSLNWGSLEPLTQENEVNLEKLVNCLLPHESSFSLKISLLAQIIEIMTILGRLQFKDSIVENGICGLDLLDVWLEVINQINGTSVLREYENSELYFEGKTEYFTKNQRNCLLIIGKVKRWVRVPGVRSM